MGEKRAYGCTNLKNVRMKILIILVVALLLPTLIVGGKGGQTQTNINSCTKISSPGAYVLNTDIMNKAGKTCISIHSNNLVLDGNGHTITGNGAGDGVNLKDSEGVTIKNLDIRKFDNGIHLENSKNNNLANNTFFSNNIGIYLQNSKTNILNNNVISSNNQNGIYLKDSKDNTVYNNFFNNSKNFQITNSKNNVWSIPNPTRGMNIVGGPFLGGNFWANPNGTGFGQTCTDSDNDGICDLSYTLDSMNIDYLPLTYKSSIPARMPPKIIGFAPSSPVYDTIGATRTFNITVNQTTNVTWYLNGTKLFNQSNVIQSTYTNSSAAQGTWNVTAVAANANGTAMQTWIWNVTQPIAAGAPNIISFIPSMAVVSDTAGAARTFGITVNQSVNVTWYLNGTLVKFNESVTNANYTNTSASLGTWNVKATATNTNGTVSKEWIWNVISSELPPDPVTVAPPLDTTVATSLATSTEFLYSGSDPIQTGVAPGTIEARRVTVLRGRVLNRDGTPLSGVNISILAHPEFGSTMSRADGMFDMAVNGGGLLTVNYEKEGYLSAQRQVQAPWQDYAWLPDVVMIQADANVTAVDLSSNAIRVARGSVVNDSDGTRQATLLFPQGIQANMTFPDGTTQPLTTMHVRATEYTVGASGPNAMPAQLPPTSGYTYAVDLTVDEAMAAGATDVHYDKPVYFYVENFLGLPVGGIVPVGYYNRTLGQWIPSENGRIIKILSITGGMADLDVDGSNQTANISQLAALNITDAERQQLAALYQPGKSLWRVPIIHFTTWDCNWPMGPPPGATVPNQPSPEPSRSDETDCVQGSIIRCQTQALGEAVDITGTPYSLHYQSDRMPGRKDRNTITIPLSDGNVSGVTEINLEIEVAGRRFKQSFPGGPNQKTTFTWDGRDAYERILNGKQPITIRIGYVYLAMYRTPAQLLQAFALYGDSLTGNRARQEVTLWREWKGEIGSLDTVGQDIGGWNLNMHDAYDPKGNVFYSGDGEERSARVLNQIITTVAGNGIGDYAGDGGPAIQASLSYPYGIAVGSDGTIYIADSHNDRIRKVGPDGIITTVAGNGDNKFYGDGGPAIKASLNTPYGVSIGSDGSLYIADSYNGRIRKVGTDGIITTVAGGPAADVGLPVDVAVGPDGSLYISDNLNSLIRRVGPDGIITTVAGNGVYGYSGDGGPAIQASLSTLFGIDVGSDGSIYISDGDNNRIRRVGPDGIITTIAGNGITGFSGDGGPAIKASLWTPTEVAVGPDGSIYIVDANNKRIRHLTPLLTGYYTGDSILVSSEDNSEIYVFNNQGKHIRTLDALNGTMRYEFAYDTADRLVKVTDGDGNVITIERNSGGDPTAIVSPYGQRTSLALDANGYLASITNPAGEAVQLAYTNDGLLTRMADPRGYIHNFSYDAMGRLIKDEDPAGGFKSLRRTEIDKGYFVTILTGLNRESIYRIEDLSNGDQKQVNIFDDLTTEKVIGLDGSKTFSYPDGTHITQLYGPDPRFGMQAPVLTSQKIITPGGLEQTITNQRTAILANKNDPFSLQNLTEMESINGRTFTDRLDMVTKTITSQTPMGRTSSATIDNKGRVMESQVPGIIPVQFTYDERGRLNNVSQGSRAYSFSYDAQGNLANITDPLSRSEGYEYDAAGRVTKQILPDGRDIQYTYDASGNVISIIPPGRPDHAFNYTPVDLIEDYMPPDIGIGAASTSYTYNIDRQLTNVTRPDGATIDLGYDSAGRLSTVAYPDGTIGITYNPVTGNLNDITTPYGGKITYAYDGSLLTDTSWSGSISGSIHRTYDNNFWITSESVNGANNVNFQYDQDGLLTQAGAMALSRDSQNGILTGTALGSVTDALSYSSFGEVAVYQAAYSGTGIFSVNYSRDDLGRIVSKNETIDGTAHIYNYSYDLAGRLTNVNKDYVPISQYVYDANGNRLSYTGAGGTISGTYDDQDRLMQFGATTYTYTANGELLSKTNGSQTTSYHYDVLSNLLNATLPDGKQIEYIVDGQNRRIGKKVNSVLVQGFLYENQLSPIVELDSTGNVVSRFVYASRGNVPDYMVRGGNTYRIITDHLGSPRLVIDAATGAVAQRMDYDEFGNVIQDTNPGFQPFGFAGGMYDRDTSLVRFGARDYDPAIGRWVAKDPIRFAGRDTNLYGYVVSDPVNYLDSYGLFWFYGNWGGPNWASGEIRSESDYILRPGDLNYRYPIDDMDALFEQHDLALNKAHNLAMSKCEKEIDFKKRQFAMKVKADRDLALGLWRLPWIYRLDPRWHIAWVVFSSFGGPHAWGY
ncbi:MAG: right-handed parallel beta-helix repeat-containing protein (plasmid) [Candidatus Methanoperedens sp.]|nr:MAG: right-handed parallel beta-helix repeat-containing protein [Candidatus Methanoperedens sp.]